MASITRSAHAITCNNDLGLWGSGPDVSACESIYNDTSWGQSVENFGTYLKSIQNSGANLGDLTISRGINNDGAMTGSPYAIQNTADGRIFSGVAGIRNIVTLNGSTSAIQNEGNSVIVGNNISLTGGPTYGIYNEGLIGASGLNGISNQGIIGAADYGSDLGNGFSSSAGIYNTRSGIIYGANVAINNNNNNSSTIQSIIRSQAPTLYPLDPISSLSSGIYNDGSISSTGKAVYNGTYLTNKISSITTSGDFSQLLSGPYSLENPSSIKGSTAQAHWDGSILTISDAGSGYDGAAPSSLHIGYDVNSNPLTLDIITTLSPTYIGDVIYGVSQGIWNDTNGNISGNNYGIHNDGIIGQSGLTGFSTKGIQNQGIINSGNGTAIFNSTSGYIIGSQSAIENFALATISGATQGILNQGYILSDTEAITNSGMISSSNLTGSAIQNSNTLGGAYASIYNNGDISGTRYGILNGGSIGYVDLSGDTSSMGIENAFGGTIGASAINGIGIQNSQGANIFGSSNNNSFGSIENSGSILGSLHAISNDGSIGYISLGNLTGIIGIQNHGNIGNASTTGAGIQNTGSIFGVNHGIYNRSNGIIQGQTYGISNSGSIGQASTYESIWGIENWGTIQSNGINSIAAIYNASTGIITGSAPHGALGGGILNETSGAILGNIKNEGTIKNILNLGRITGNITNSGNIEAVNVSTGTFEGSVYNSGHIEELYLGSHTLFLTGNNSATLGPGANYDSGATINIGSQTTTASFTSTSASQFSDPTNMLNNFNINAGSTFNAYEGTSVIRSTEFTNNGTLSIKANSQLTVDLGVSPAAYTHNGLINIGINGSSSGQLIILGGAMFNGSIGILPGSVVSEGTYASIIKNDASGSVTDTTLTAANPYYVYNRRKYSYEAILNDSDTDFPFAFDLRFTDIGAAGPAASDTQAAIKNTVARLRGTFNVASHASGFANMNTYDCNLFDKNNMCISVGGRYTTVDNPSNNNSSAVVVLGYKASPNMRIGGFLDQSVHHSTPQGLHVSNKNPLVGAFAIWNQSQDGLGFQMKLANTYQDKDISTVRDVIGTSEAGRGNTNLNIQSYVAELSYAFNHQDKLIVRPYFALRHTKMKQDAFTESGVDNPLSVAKLNDRALTSLLGAKFNYAMTPRLNLVGSLGVEQDLTRKVDQFVATSSNIEGLSAEAFSSKVDRTRAVASIGAYYAVQKNQRVSMDVYFQESAFGGRNSTTGYLNYMIGF